MDAWGGGLSDEEFMDGNYVYGPEVDKEKMEQFYADNVDKDLEREKRWWDSEGQAYENLEDVFAYYGMTTVNAGNFMFLLGFRH